jgi:hypothetical protein
VSFLDKIFSVISPSIIVDPSSGMAVPQNEQTIDIAAVPGVAIGSASAASSAVGATTKRVVLIPDTDCWVSIGANPTAAKQSAGSFPLAAKSPSYPIKVVPGVTKIAVIQDSAAGYLSIIESL